MTFLSLHDLDELWQKTLSLLEQEMIRPSFETWIKVLQPISHTNGTFTLGTTRQIVKEWVETRYLPLIRKSIEALLDQPVIVLLELIPSDSISTPSPTETLISKTRNEAPAVDIKPSPVLKNHYRSLEENISPLNPKYTFDSFVIGNSNRFAHAAALAVAEVPAKVYNPFFIYGGVGLGKTHLMHAIGHRIMQIFET